MKCTFCGSDIQEGRGKTFVKNDGRIFRFCSSKCQNNWKLGRDGKSVRWTERSRSTGN